MAALSVEGLNKTFRGGLFEKDRQVLRDINFSLAEGKTTGFVGSNGAGKTTTIKCLFDFIHPDSGSIKFFGQPIDSEVKTRIGYLPERPYLYEFLTGTEFLKLHWNLCYGSQMKDFAERAQESLRKVDLLEAKDRRLRTYSKVMLQRIGIAQAILTRPDLLILDEPMSGLDPIGRHEVRDLIASLHDEGKTVFFSTHILSDLERVAFNIAFLSRGRIALHASQDELLDEIRLLSGPIGRLQAAVDTHGGQVLSRRDLGEQPRWLVRFASGRLPESDAALRCEALNLEDLFLEMTQ